MNAIDRDRVAEAARTTPEERATQLVDVIATGIRLKRAALRTRFATESEDEIDQRLLAWLGGDDRA